MMLRSVALTLAAMAVCLSSTSAFTTVSPVRVSTHRSTSSLEMQKGAKSMAGALATACLLANVMAADPAMAMPTADFGTSQVVAARSGGRAGGRAPSRMMAPSRSAPSTSRSYSRTTIVRPMISSPPIVVSPFGGGYGYGYNPMGGFGLGYGLGAMNNAGNAVTDYRQESEIQRSKAELEEAEKKNIELEQRIKALEQAQQAAKQ